MRANTKFVEYCIIPTNKTNKSCALIDFIIGLCFAKLMNKDEKINPEKHHKKNVLATPDKRITFFIKIASVPENIKAKTL